MNELQLNPFMAEAFDWRCNRDTSAPAIWSYFAWLRWQKISHR